MIFITFVAGLLFDELRFCSDKYYLRGWLIVWWTLFSPGYDLRGWLDFASRLTWLCFDFWLPSCRSKRQEDYPLSTLYWPRSPMGLTLWGSHCLSGTVVQQTLTSPSDSVLCLIGLKYALFSSNTKHCPTVKSESACSCSDLRFVQLPYGSVWSDQLLWKQTVFDITNGPCLCPRRIMHARFLSDTTHCPMVTSKFVCHTTVSNNWWGVGGGGEAFLSQERRSTCLNSKSFSRTRLLLPRVGLMLEKGTSLQNSLKVVFNYVSRDSSFNFLTQSLHAVGYGECRNWELLC